VAKTSQFWFNQAKCLNNKPLVSDEFAQNSMTNEPRHDKTNIVRLRPAWIQTSLRIRAV
jgi:hypothetical protein